MLLGAFVLLVAMANLTSVHATFTGVTSNGPNQFTAGSTFPTYPQQVTADGAQFYHRGDEAVSGAATQTAADSSGNARPGVYATALDGTSTWWRLTDASGTTAEDSSGNTNPGSLTNGATWTTGPFAGALNFDGVDDYVSGVRASVDTTASFTMSAKVRLTAVTASQTLLSQSGSLGSAIQLTYNQPTNRWRMLMPRTNAAAPVNDFADSTDVPVVGAWTLLTAVYDAGAGMMSLYVDGRLSSTAAHSTTWSATGPLTAGRRLVNGGWTDYLNGRLVDVRTWRRALTATDVAILHHLPTTEWDFDETTSGWTTDVSGHRNDGYLTNGVTWNGGSHTGWTAAALDGSAGYLYGTDPGLRTNADFTIATWVYLTATAGGSKTAVSVPGTHTSGVVLKYDQSSATWAASMTTSDVAAPTTDTAVSKIAAVTNSWVHLAVVYDSGAGEVRLYVNGTLAGTKAHTTGWAAAGPLTVGRARLADTDTDYWPGRIDETRTYDHALTDAGITDLSRGWTTRYDFDEAAGSTTAADASGNRNVGTLSSVTMGSAGVEGGAASFNGTSSALTGTAAPVNASQNFTVAAWVYMTNSSVNRTAVSQDGPNFSPFFLQYNGFGWGMSMATTGGAVTTALATATVNVWTHLVGVYDAGAGQLKLYVNGVLADTKAFSGGFNSAGPVTVGRAYWGGNIDFWAGYIDQVRLAPWAFGAADVAALYADTAAAVDWQFSEGAGTTVADATGHGRTGTLAGGATWNTGYSGSAVAVDGTNGRVTGASGLLRTDASFSVSAWVYATTLAGANRTVLSQDGTNVSGFFLQYDNTASKWAMALRDADSTAGGEARVTGGTPALTTWTHLVGVYDDTTDQVRLYINGVLAGTAAHTVDWQAAGAFVAGRGYWSGAAAQYFAGRIDNVRAYGRPLGPRDVALLYAGGRVPTPAQTRPAMATAGVTGALQGAQQGQQASTAIAFTGDSNGYNPIQYTNPGDFTTECWFRTTGTRGGALIGFSANSTGRVDFSYDRMTYVDSGGRLSFGVWTGVASTLRSTATVNDGAWHHVAASVGPAGLKLYADGELVDSDPSITTGENATGYWRWGGNRTDGWPNAPLSNFLTGLIDEVAVYPTQLTDRQIRRHFYANH